MPLLSQNISIIEVGAYSHIFDKFIDFLGIKSLVITDLDATNEDSEKCRVSDGISYSNSAISHYFGGKTINELKNYILTDKIFNKVNDTWTVQEMVNYV